MNNNFIKNNNITTNMENIFANDNKNKDISNQKKIIDNMLIGLKNGYKWNAKKIERIERDLSIIIIIMIIILIIII